MTVDRRCLLGGAALAALAAPIAASAQTTDKPKPSLTERYAAQARANRFPLAYDGRVFSGPGWELLAREGRDARFTLMGEDHFMVEVPRLNAQLYAALQPTGYDRVSVEISPPAAAVMDATLLRGGLPAWKRWLDTNHGGVAFYNLKAEAEFVAAVRAATPGRDQVIWGTDYEVGADRALIARLEAIAPPAARSAVRALKQASDAAWAEFAATKNPMTMFSFGGDPERVRAVRAAWPRPNEETRILLDTLEQTLVVNGYYRAERYYLSNQTRADFQRANFLRQWRKEAERGRKPKVLLKYGAGHMIRGLSLTYNFDLGTLVSELAMVDGGHAFRVLLLGGPGAVQGVFNPVEWKTVPTPVDPLSEMGLGLFEAELFPRGFTVFDLRPLRVLPAGGADPKLVRIVHGFDALVVLPNATPSVFL